MAQSPASCVFTISSAYLFFTKMWVMTSPTNAVENTIIRASAPVSQGRETCGDFRTIGTYPVPVGGSADITSLYTARFGAPPVAKKVYLRINQFVGGWESLPTTFWAIVPASP